MEIENVWIALLSMIVGIFFAIAFGPVFDGMIAIADVSARIFLGMSATILMYNILIRGPWSSILVDDKGRTN